MISVMKRKLLLCLALIALLFPSPGRAESAPADLRGETVNYLTRSDLRILSEGADETGGILPRGTEVTVMETKEDPRLGTMVRLGVDSDDPTLPAEVWVSMKDVVASGLDKQQEADVDELAAEEGSLFLDARGGGKKMTYCYRYVKLYLIKIKKVKSYLPGISAYMAANILPKFGFSRTTGGPQTAKMYDVCVYAGGNKGNGHIEIRVPGGWNYGYGIKPTPITRVNHPFLGCFRK